MKENRTPDQVLGDMGYARRMYARPPATPEGARSSEAGVQISGVEDPVLKDQLLLQAARPLELILGLTPMTMFDAAARPMWNAFSNRPDLAGYANQPARVPLDIKNPAHSALAERSNRLDFSESDLADARELNEILWLAIRGTPPPGPLRKVVARSSLLRQ